MPQRPIVRRKQKQRRTKQLAEWRAKQEQEATGEVAAPKPPATKTVSKPKS